VGVKLSGGFFAFFLTSFFSLQAAPMLRLASSTVGPVQLASAGATNTQTLEAYNGGDGSLSLTFASSASWVTVAAGAPRNCVTVTPSNTKTCTPITFSINSSGLPQGLSTATVTVSGDSSTVDAPQTVVVLVRIGTVEMYSAPGGTRDIGFATSNYVLPTVKTNDGGKWLTVASSSFGSFQFNYSYAIHLQPPAAMASGDYTGSFTLTGSNNPTDNQTIPVTMHVTTQPIAVATAATTFGPQPNKDALVIRLAQGAPPLAYPFDPYVQVGNVGQGSLSLQTPVITGSWLKADPAVAGFYAIDPTGLAVGDNPGSIAFPSNAANGTVTVPVNLQIVAKGNPQIYYGGVQANVAWVPGDPVAPGDVLIVEGEQLSFSAPTYPSAPFPAASGATAVLVNGAAVPLYYTSYGLIAFQLPYDLASGKATIQVKRDDGTSNLASITVEPRVPRLYSVIFNQDGSINSAANRAPVGSVITVYGIGFGATSPAVTAGQAAPSSPLAEVTSLTTVSFGFGFFATQVKPYSFAGLTPTIAGIYQANATVPAGTPSGPVNLSLSVAGATSNVVTVYVQ
jgi:uncharacterized protein (TIGR03437 family)